MRVYIEWPNKTSLPCMISATDTVGTLLNMIKFATIRNQKIILLKEGMILDPNNSFVFYNIEENDRIFVQFVPILPHHHNFIGPRYCRNDQSSNSQFQTYAIQNYCNNCNDLFSNSNFCQLHNFNNICYPCFLNNNKIGKNSKMFEDENHRNDDEALKYCCDYLIDNNHRLLNRSYNRNKSIDKYNSNKSYNENYTDNYTNIDDELFEMTEKYEFDFEVEDAKIYEEKLRLRDASLRSLEQRHSPQEILKYMYSDSSDEGENNNFGNGKSDLVIISDSVGEVPDAPLPVPWSCCEEQIDFPPEYTECSHSQSNEYNHYDYPHDYAGDVMRESKLGFNNTNLYNLGFNIINNNENCSEKNDITDENKVSNENEKKSNDDVRKLCRSNAGSLNFSNV
ncbi:hypothetical protein TRFO_31239 [Tritrichomonas foetus]|uniref:Ubiquitin-like domain-containing protein n=1 Tax=Tritrichomonas foetus TaxID=1144522 RepID=A0A1J4JTV1_9EUKA|nr:hypothetical protein TRFO_31239 [Tritrichomonas foetus]|eukprot:OHT01888.1 hypothetical protein TRFO_31239 [Tritrichomonas foetus]